MDSLSIVGNIASIAGLIISCLVLWGVNKIEKHYLFKARIPDLMKSLEEYAGNLITSFDTKDTRDVVQVVVIIKSILKNLSRKVGSEISSEIDELNTKIEYYIKTGSKAKYGDNDNAYEIYTSLLAIIETLKQHHKDSEWS